MPTDKDWNSLLFQAYKTADKSDFEAHFHARKTTQNLKRQTTLPGLTDQFLKDFGEGLGINEVEVKRQRNYFAKGFKK